MIYGIPGFTNDNKDRINIAVRVDDGDGIVKIYGVSLVPFGKRKAVQINHSRRSGNTEDEREKYFINQCVELCTLGQMQTAIAEAVKMHKEELDVAAIEYTRKYLQG